MDKFSITYQTIEFRQHFGEHLTIEQAAFAAGLKPGIIRKIISYELIEIVKDDSEPVIHIDYIPKLRKMVRLHYDLGIGWNSMGVVLDLLNRIEELENNHK